MLSLKLRAVASALDVIVEVAGRFAAWSGLALVLVMAFNVLLRYLFRTGSVAMQELEWHLMSPLALLCMAYAIKHEGHVRVDILFGRLPARARQVIELVSCLLAVAFCVIIINLSWGYVAQSYVIGEKSPDPGGLQFRFLLKAMIPSGFALLLLHSVAATMRSLADLMTSLPDVRPVSDNRLENAA